MQPDNPEENGNDHPNDKSASSSGLKPKTSDIPDHERLNKKGNGDNAPTIAHIWRRIKWLVVFNVIIAAAAASQAYYTHRQIALTQDGLELTKQALVETQRATDLAERTAKVEQRAWLSFSFRMQDEPIQQEPFRVALPLINTGTTPAFNVRYRSVVATASADSETRPRTAEWEAQPWHNADVVFPAEQNRFLSLIGPLQPGFLEAYRAGRTDLWTFIELRYCDAFEQSHWIKSCAHRTFDPNDAGFIYCGNETDRNDSPRDEEECQP